MDLITRLGQFKILPVIAIDRAMDILPLGATLADNGLPLAEITFRTDAAADAIALLRQSQPAMLIGAGTVLNRQQMEMAVAAGADFIVSPGLNVNTVRAAQELGVPIIPGVNNPSDIELALELGLTALKFFPAEASGGIKMIKALHGPYPQVRFIPTGGIGLQNIRDYLAQDAVIACGTSWIVESDLINQANWQELAKRVRDMTALVNSQADKIHS